MDCVECEKCKVYGKMQIAGIGTALKILFSGKEQGVLPSIRRNELIVENFKMSNNLKILLILGLDEYIWKNIKISEHFRSNV